MALENGRRRSVKAALVIFFRLSGDADLARLMRLILGRLNATRGTGRPERSPDARFRVFATVPMASSFGKRFCGTLVSALL